ncbi:acyl-CoA dehydrogenase [Novosphingobium sp. 1529]|uniref:acyl-CoA dehydrogenase family protein n=1 Tax=Novosphingobium sp. 1529 TaxID=3156424 RepID=UPI0014940973
MDFDYTPKQRTWMDRVGRFMQDEVIPTAPLYHRQLDSGPTRWHRPAVVETLKARAKAAGLWNMFMPANALGHAANDFVFDCPALSNLEYAPLAEMMGRLEFSSQVFNCAAPDTGNMEVFLRYGSPEQQERWLKPLMTGDIRSAFLMTEPDVASSDATNIETSILADGADYVINGRKWWSSGMGEPDCDIMIVMGKTDPAAPVHLQQSMILVPRDTPGVEVVRMLPVFGYDDAPHGHAEVILDNVRVPAANMLLGPGRGFEIAQGRLGPGRIHHCMRTIGAAEAALERMCERLVSRRAFGKSLYQHSVWEERIARARMDIEMARLLTLKTADMMDKVGPKGAQVEISMIKVAVPRIALSIVDEAIQAHGGAGVSDDFGLGRAYANLRTMRLVDGPDDVHNRGIARMELKPYLTRA